MAVSGQVRSGRLHMSVLGGFSLADANRRPIAIVNRKACALLAYLALSKHGRETRERLAGLLWSDKGEEQARASLRQVLKQLREIFSDAGFEGFATERQDVALAADLVSVDLRICYDKLLREEVVEQLLSQDGRPERILYGYDNLDGSFTAWLHVVRQNWHDRFVDRLGDILNNNAAERARHAAEALVNIDPSHEDAHRLIIRHHADAGNTAAALRHYGILWELLDSEFDMEPDDETQDLIAAIKSGCYQAAEKTPAIPVGRRVAVAGNSQRANRPVIIVPPFAQGGPWAQEVYFIEGFRRELIASLVRFREWLTFGSTGTQQLQRAHEHDERQRYIVEGTYLGEENTARLIITLKESDTQQFVWSENFELSLSNWFHAQRLIVRRVAIALNIHLSAERISRFAGSPEVDLNAYDCWLRGQELVFGFTPDSWDRAAEVFQSIVDQNVSFAPVYSSLAQLENGAHLVFPGKRRLRQVHEQALELGKVAVQIDPLDTRGHLSMGWSYAMLDQFERSAISYDLACDLNENDPWTLVSSALGWSFLDDCERARKMADQALVLSLQPTRMHWGYQATIRFLCGDYAGCVEAADNSGFIIKNVAAWKAAALVHLGRQDDARRAAREFRGLVQDSWVGDVLPDDEVVAQWFLGSFPIKNTATWQTLKDGIEQAGIAMAPDVGRHSDPLVSQ